MEFNPIVPMLPQGVAFIIKYSIDTYLVSFQIGWFWQYILPKSSQYVQTAKFQSFSYTVKYVADVYAVFLD